mmetsp:Transcript_40277/g.86453  ORF Transcript_40277/g.86453 Transcript_40277/m.86453 type:complete len:203 (+) Transcript_40277:1466-2074(+)
MPPSPSRYDGPPTSLEVKGRLEVERVEAGMESMVEVSGLKIGLAWTVQTTSTRTMTANGPPMAKPITSTVTITAEAITATMVATTCTMGVGQMAESCSLATFRLTSQKRLWNTSSQHTGPSPVFTSCQANPKVATLAPLLSIPMWKKLTPPCRPCTTNTRSKKASAKYWSAKQTRTLTQTGLNEADLDLHHASGNGFGASAM